MIEQKANRCVTQKQKLYLDCWVIEGIINVYIPLLALVAGHIITILLPS
jgi:hypothetical protein